MARNPHSQQRHAVAVTAGSDEVIDLRVVDRIVEKKGNQKSSAIPILQAVQSQFGYLPRPALTRVCEITEITPAQIEGVATFYSQFRQMPVGKHLISVCHGTACHVAGAERVTEALLRHLGIEGETDTDADGLFTVQKVPCIGCCSLAPVMRIDERVYGWLTPESAPRAVERFLRDQAARASGKGRPPDARAPKQDRAATPVEVRVGLASCCMASGGVAVKDALEGQIRKLGVDAVVRSAGCAGMCYRDPVVEFPGGARYGNVTPDVVSKIVRGHLRPVGTVRRAKEAFGRFTDLLCDDWAWETIDSYAFDADRGSVEGFLAKQKRVVLEGCGELDPADIQDYVRRGGYLALESCVKTMCPEDVIQTVKASGLRGRGGAGYPTGHKWDQVRHAPGLKKYVIVNGDEGDPGAFMDRLILESCPHRILEGVAIAAFAVGADEVYFYVRREYPLAVERAHQAIRQAEERGYLGEGILGTDFCLKVHVAEGAGAFVCGEETGLIAALEGRRGVPRLRPPYPAESGLWGRPTNINNVETYANVPWIIRHGPEAFAAIGTANSRGTKVFALAGAINRGGLIEVPMGITIGEIVEDIGGGIPEGHTFKAVQIGGPSGGCIPATLRGVRIDYEALRQYGAMMGSGGLVVIDETTCMVDVARYFLQFTQDQSCGQCTFCRIGTKRMLEILDRLCRGDGRTGDLELLEELANHVRRTSLCGLGRAAPNPVLTTLRYFRDEYEAHTQGRCPAKRCRALIAYRITDDCIGCTLCAQHCPVQAIEPRPYEKHEIDTDKCIRCGTCQATCPNAAIEIE